MAVDASPPATHAMTVAARAAVCVALITPRRRSASSPPARRSPQRRARRCSKWGATRSMRPLPRTPSSGSFRGVSVWWAVRRFQANGQCPLAPVNAHHSLIVKHYGKVNRHRFHVRRVLWSNINAK